MASFLNIKFPFKDSGNGYYYESDRDTKNLVKSNFIHMLLTNEGDRYYRPTFGLNLRKYLFDMRDGATISEIKSKIREKTTEWFSDRITVVDIDITNEGNNGIVVIINYTFKENNNVFSDNITLQF